MGSVAGVEGLKMSTSISDTCARCDDARDLDDRDERVRDGDCDRPAHPSSSTFPARRCGKILRVTMRR